MFGVDLVSGRAQTFRDGGGSLCGPGGSRGPAKAGACKPGERRVGTSQGVRGSMVANAVERAGARMKMAEVGMVG